MDSVQIKVCGITSISDALLLNQFQVDYAGIVLFYPKSKRNMVIEEATQLMQHLNSDIKKVAVVVSPNMEQIIQIEEAAFDFIQVHGDLTKEMLDGISLPVFRAFHIENHAIRNEADQMNRYYGFVLDGKVPGSGNKFDWNLAKQFKYKKEHKKLVLAGGLTCENVKDGILEVEPDIVDVSSGVENEAGTGKDKEKIRRFVEAVRTIKV